MHKNHKAEEMTSKALHLPKNNDNKVFGRDRCKP